MKNFQPMGLIPEFNAWGNHPSDMESFISEKVVELYSNCGIKGYQKGKEILLKSLDALSVRPNTFTGHYVPCDDSKAVLKWLIGTFVKAEECKLFGSQNYQKALELINSGHNVLAVMNHATALDCLISEELTSEIRPNSFTPSFIASQVFEYARIANIVTSGFDKYPVFQPKHIQKMKDSGCECAVKQMRMQNQITLRSLCSDVKVGSKMIYLFPEKNRSIQMGVPEPIVSRLPCLMQMASKKELYVLPMYVNGGETIFPNVPGTNELDNFLQNLRVGQGDMYCGEPIPFSKIQNTLCCIDKLELVKATLGEVPTDAEYLNLSALSVLITGSIASLSPIPERKAIYNNCCVEKAMEILKN